MMFVVPRSLSRHFDLKGRSVNLQGRTMRYVDCTNPAVVAYSISGPPAPSRPLPINAAALIERCLGNHRLACEFIRLFRVAYPECVDRLRAALAASDALAARTAARRLRDTAAKVNAEEIASVAEHIESAAAGGDLTAARARFHSLSDAWENFDREARLD
jgi:hypothetical protein